MIPQAAATDRRTASGTPGAPAVHPTEQRALDEAVARLRDAAPGFARLPIPERIALARSMQSGYLQVAERMVAAGCLAKGLQPGTPAEAEEWATGPWAVVRHLRLVTESLASIQRTGNTPVGTVRRGADDRLAVQVFPASGIDRVLFAGITVEARMAAGVDEAEMHASRAAFYRGRQHDGRTVLVLGAGNLPGIAPMDVISKLFNEGKVCLLKVSPVNAYLGPLIEEAFAEAIRRNFLAVVQGGMEEGAYLARHPGIDEIHLTGTSRTYDTLMWGAPGPERDARRARGTPVLSKPVTAELGTVSPVLVVPGPYTARELAFQAEAIAGAVAYNASFNCNTPNMLVTPRGWPRRADLLKAIEGALAGAPVRRSYYPGAEDRWRQLTSGRTGITTVGTAGPGELPWTLLPGLDATDPREPAFQTEPFCSVLSETEVGSDDPVEFLERAVDFANNRLWGTLSAELVVHPASLKDPRIAQALDRAIARLRYGVVTVNAWSGFAFVYGTPPWGAYPGASPSDIQSGTGWVHNTSMLENVEKSILRHPLTIVPKPATFPSNRMAHVVTRRLARLEHRASWSKVPGVVVAAMRG
jgi:acyl-CoA reductase-like NAD-dependent aldehyde dehydrogenase